MRNITVWLWLVLAGAALQLSSLTTDYFMYEGKAQSAWMGLPTTAELVLLCALVALVMVGLIVAARSPFSGAASGRIVAAAGLVATLQLTYRVIAPPFGSIVPDHVSSFTSTCMFWCLPAQALPADPQPGMWMAIAASATVAIGGLLHSLSTVAKATPARPWAASAQAGLTPWLSLAALGAVGQTLFGFTLFTFYRTIGTSGAHTWSGWLPMPHTASWVFAISVAIVLLVWAAARRRAPLDPSDLGALIAVLAFTSTARIGFRIADSPFGPTTNVEIGPAAYLSLLSGLLAVVAGAIQSAKYRVRNASS